MKTLDQAIIHYKPYLSDGKDKDGLLLFIPTERWAELGFHPQDVPNYRQHREWTRENILDVLKNHLAFGFIQASRKRFDSTILLFHVVRMWNWVLEEGLENWEPHNYVPYGSPLFRATAEKYGWHHLLRAHEESEG